MRAELRRVILVVVAADELQSAVVSGDTARITAAMQRYAVARSSTKRERSIRYDAAFKAQCVRIALRAGCTRAAQLAGVGRDTMVRWRASLAPSAPKPPRRKRVKLTTPPGRAYPAKRARALIDEMYPDPSKP